MTETLLLYFSLWQAHWHTPRGAADGSGIQGPAYVRDHGVHGSGRPQELAEGQEAREPTRPTCEYTFLNL